MSGGTAPVPDPESVEVLDHLGFARWPDTNEWHLDYPNGRTRVYVEWVPYRRRAGGRRGDPQWCVSAALNPTARPDVCRLVQLAAEIDNPGVLRVVAEHAFTLTRVTATQVYDAAVIRDDPEHPEHAECADGCGLAVTHDDACLDRPGGRQVCKHDGAP